MNTARGPAADLTRWFERVRSSRIRRAAPGQTPQAPGVKADPAETWLSRWQALTGRFDARSPRERMLLGLAALGLVVQVFDTAYLSPGWRDWNQARKALQTSQAAVEALSGSVATVAARADTENRLALADLQRLRALYGSDTEGSPAGAETPTGGLVAARDMLPLLEQLLERHGGVKIVSFQSLGQTPLGRSAAGPDMGAAKPSAAAASKAPIAAPQGVSSPAIYRHGVELTLEGSYAELVAYLQAVEALPQRLLWGSLRLKVDEHPRVVLTVRLYTLSLDRQWAEI